MVGARLYLLTAAFPSSTPTRPIETVRIDIAKPGGDKEAVQTTANVPAPQGTVRRMDAISKSFSKK